MLCFEVGDGFDVLVQVHVASAEVPVRHALPRPVAHLLCNRQVLRVVLDGLAEVPLRLIRDAQRFPYAMPSPARSPTSFAIARRCAWYSMALHSPPATDTRCRGSRTPCPPPPGRPPPLQSPGPARGLSMAFAEVPLRTDTRCPGSRTPCPPPPGRPPPLQSPGAACGTRWPC